MKHTKVEIPITKLVGNSGQLPGVPKNPRKWSQGDVMRLAKSIQETPELLELRGLIAVEHEGKYVVLGGNLRLAAGRFLNLKTMPVEVVEDCTTAKMKEIAIKDNGAFGQWDASALLEEWGDSPLGEWGVVKDDPLGNDEDYKKFVEKFQPKKTTDDCYTPPAVYDAVCDYLEEEYHLNRVDIVRPFVPGGDYKNYQYPANAIVVDNPPFSIMKEILTFYKEREIPFFLFAQAKTILQHASSGSCAVCVCANVVYENGAEVGTSFYSGLPQDRGILAKSAPKLASAIRKAQGLPDDSFNAIREYDEHVVLFSFLDSLSRYGFSFEIPVGLGRAVKFVGGTQILGKCVLVSDAFLDDVNEMREKVANIKEEKMQRIRLNAKDLEIIKNLSK